MKSKTFKIIVFVLSVIECDLRRSAHSGHEDNGLISKRQKDPEETRIDITSRIVFQNDMSVMFFNVYHTSYYTEIKLRRI